MARIVKWQGGIDPEDTLFVCPCCAAELHADCVGDTCPNCGEDMDGMDAIPTPPKENEE